MLNVHNCHVQLESRAVLRALSLELCCGQLHGVLGPNGSGKSTLFKALAGLIPLQHGEIYWNGDPLSTQSRRDWSQICSLVPQTPSISFDYSVEEIVRMGLYASGDLDQESAVTNALKLVDAYHLRQRSINKISAGERQRVYIARALVTDAPILLLDEPTSNLDIRHQLEIWSLLRELVRPDRLIIAALHDLHIAAEFCDAVTVLDQGNCKGSGPYSDVVSSQLLGDTFGVAKVPESALHQFTLAK